MPALIWSGAVISLVGLLGLIYFIVSAVKLRKQPLEDEAMRAALQKLIPINLGSLLLSVLGLCCVIMGIYLS
ncbi:MAG: hypothetical protein ABF310_01555 [Paracoccaceae bacterium]|jgi:heme exporter protein D